MFKKLSMLVAVALLVVMTVAGTAFAAVPTVWSADETAAFTGASKPSVCYDGTQYHMWYLSGNELKHVTSNDLTNWTDAGSFTYDLAQYADNPFVLKADDGKYYMWCTDVTGANVLLFTSGDGNTWTGPQTVFSKGTGDVWDGVKIDHPMVMWDGTEYKMYYQGKDSASNYCIGLATATTITGEFTRANNSQPVLTPTADSWDSYRVFQPWVVKNGDEYYMFYAGNSSSYTAGPDAIGVAVSYDGSTWTKQEQSILGTEGSITEAHPAVAHYNGTWHIWYLKGSDIYHATSVYNQASAQVTFTVAEAAVPGYPSYPYIIGVSVSDLNLGPVEQGASKTDSLTITNTGTVAETFECVITQAPTNSGNTVEVTAPTGPIAAGQTGNATVTVTAGSTTGSDSAIITVTATAAP